MPIQSKILEINLGSKKSRNIAPKIVIKPPSSHDKNPDGSVTNVITSTIPKKSKTSQSHKPIMTII